jgi:hypothetical protein
MLGRHTEMPNTDFAITAMDVPDRLDQREADDRKHEDEESHYTRPGFKHYYYSVRRFAPWLILLGILAWLGVWISNARDNVSPGRIAQRLSSALHVQVRVQDTHLRSTPSPALVLTGVDLGPRLHLDEIDIEFTAPNLWQALASGHRRWGDVAISPTSMTLDQAKLALSWIGGMDQAVPDSVTKVRFRELRITGSRLLPDRYEAFSRRETNGKFMSAVLRTVDPPGSMQVQLTPDAGVNSVAFQCDAAEWRPPFGPRTAWSEFVASGHVAESSFEVEQFSIGATFGGVEGHLSVRRRDHGSPAWLASGAASSVGIDLPTLVQQLTGKTASFEGAVQNSPILGTAAIEAAVVGGGDTLDAALGDLAADGTVKVRNAELKGVNLGFEASHPSNSGGSGGGGGTTRFSEFSSQFVAGGHGVTLRQIRGVAGALTARGEVMIGSDLNLAGLLHVDLGGSRIQAPLRMRIAGTVEHPEYHP